MRRRLGVPFVALVATAALAPAAGAHPLGNFSVNHLVVVRASADRVDLRYILDEAEIPTFRQRGLAPAEVLQRTRAIVARGVALSAGGRPVAIGVARGGRISFPPGQGGLHTTRVEIRLGARARLRGPVRVRDATFPGRIGWRAIVVRPGRGTAVRASVPSADPTRGLRVYPRAVLSSPADRAVARLNVRVGAGTVVAPRLAGPGTEVSRAHAAGDGLAGIFADAAAGRGVLLLLLLAAFGWGAVHALSPGHGKTMVAAYLIGTRGTARHAVGLGLTVTVTHTLGVFALGVVTLALSQVLLPEDLFPWLNLASGLLVLVVGGGVLRGRLRGARRRADDSPSHQSAHNAHLHGYATTDYARERNLVSGDVERNDRDPDRTTAGSRPGGERAGGDPAGDHHHRHGIRRRHRGAQTQGHHHHGGAGGGAHAHDHRGHGAHGHHDDQGGHGVHAHHHDLSRRGVVAMGASAGLIPCPSALVVLLGAVAQHRIALGLLLIVAFSAGLAATLTALGVAVVRAGRLAARIRPSGRLVALLPAASALVIVAVGLVLTARALPGVLG